MTTSDTTPTNGRTSSTARRWASLAALVAVVVGGAALLVATGGDDEARTCDPAGAAEVCLVGNGPEYEIEGTGFRPGSEVILTGESSQPMVVRADDRGEFPDAGGILGVLGGDGPQRFVLSGTASDGTPASVELAVPAREG